MTIVPLPTRDADTAPPQPLRTEAIRRLLRRYGEALAAVDCEPHINPLGIVRFYWRLIIWSAAMLYGIALVAAVNVVRFVMAQTRRKPFTTWKFGSRIVRTFTAPFRSVHRGEVPILKLLTFRSVTRLLALLHVRRTLLALAGEIERGAMLRYVADADGSELAAARQEAEFLRSYAEVTSKRAELKLLLLAAPVVALGAEAYGVFDVGKKVFQWFQQFSPLQWLHHLGTGITAGMYVLLMITSSFIRKRELMLDCEVYQLQHDAADYAGVQARREIPLDLWGCIFVVLMPMFLMLLQLLLERYAGGNYGLGQDDLVTICMITTIYLSPVMYALIRRVQLDRR